MQIVFFGTPNFAKEILEFLLLHKIDIKAVVTQPDSVNGARVQISPVKEYVSKLAEKIVVLQPEKASDPKFIQTLKSFNPDLFVVVAYGQILRQELLDVPRLGAINVHASLLPKYRGAAPMQRALLNGERETGITIMKMVLKMDAGDMIAAEKVKIEEGMTFDELSQKLCDVAKPLLLKVIFEYERGLVKGLPQDESKVTYAGKILKEDRLIDWSQGAKEINDQIRAFAMQPGAFCDVLIGEDKKSLKILKSKVKNLKLGSKKYLDSERELIVGCGDLSLEILEVQLEGKKRMPAAEFLRGLKSKLTFL